MTRTYAIVAGSLIVALLGAMFFLVMRGPSGDQFAQCRQSQVATGAASIGGPFTLVDEQGRTVSDEDVITGPTLIYFGYTFCPDVCPFDNARNAEAVDLLDERGIEVTPVFITVDPERDTPEVMANYTQYMHSRMLGLTGSLEQVRTAASAYRVYYNRHEAESDDEFYLVDHTTFTYLMFPGNRFADFFRRDAAPQDIADSVACFAAAS